MTAEPLVVPLHEIAHGRAGDKGNRCNISVIAYVPDAWPILVDQVTAERVKAFFAHRGATHVTRYELPRLAALNLDGHGKTLAYHLLALEIDVPEDVLGAARLARARP